jgi:hypothetical protein
VVCDFHCKHLERSAIEAAAAAAAAVATAALFEATLLRHAKGKDVDSDMLLPLLKLGRLKSLRRGLLFAVALVIVLLLTPELNVRQRVCDIRDWEFASSILTSPKFVSRGPMLLHNANGSCTITWESLSHTSLHLIQPKPPVHSQFTASSIWLGHNIGLMEVPFGCAWNVRSIRDKKCASILILICTPQVYHLQLASCPPLVAFRICS